MPTSRNARCTRVLKRFADQFDIEYKLENLHIRGWKQDEYEIKFSKYWETYHLVHNTERGELEWVTHTFHQTLPRLSAICDRFEEMFEPYELEESFVRINEAVCDNDNIILKVKCAYSDKTHFPYPDDEDTLRSIIASLERENSKLKEKLDATNRYITIYNLDQETRNTPPPNVLNSLKKYREMARISHIEKNEKTECPVCMENILDANLFVTPCNHVLCTECSTRCKNKCPMCRNTLAL